MRTITEEDLANVFLLIFKADKKGRDHLPFIRRHFKSVLNLCAKFEDKNCEIFFSGIFVAKKMSGSKKIIMSREYQKTFGGEVFYG